MSAKEITYFGCGYLFCIVISISNNIGLEFRDRLDIGLELPVTWAQTSTLTHPRWFKHEITCIKSLEYYIIKIGNSWHCLPLPDLNEKYP